MIRLILIFHAAALLFACMPARDMPGEGASAIPAALQGRWGLTAADCTPGRSDAKGLMTIGGDGLAFYESRARLVALSAASDSGVSGTFTYSGEGQTWSRTETLELGEGGTRLTRLSVGDGAVPGAQVYTACS